jgi:hypothetical protein
MRSRVFELVRVKVFNDSLPNVLAFFATATAQCRASLLATGSQTDIRAAAVLLQKGKSGAGGTYIVGPIPCENFSVNGHCWKINGRAYELSETRTASLLPKPITNP